MGNGGDGEFGDGAARFGGVGRHGDGAGRWVVEERREETLRPKRGW